HFRAASILQWHPGWAQDSPDLAAPFFRMGGTANFGSSTMFGLLLQKTWNGVIAPFFQFWLTNFGLWIPLALALVGLVGWRIWKSGWRWGDRLQRTSPLSCRQLLSSPRGTFSKPPHGNGTTLSSWSGVTFLFFLFFGAISLGAGRFRNGRRCALRFSVPDLLPCWVDSLPDTRA